MVAIGHNVGRVVSIWYLPCSSLLLIIISSSFTVINTSSSLCTMTPCFIHINTLPSSLTLATLNSKVGKSVKVWDSSTSFDSQGIGRGVTGVAVLVSQLATLTLFVGFFRMGICDFFFSVGLAQVIVVYSQIVGDDDCGAVILCLYCCDL